MGVVEVDTVHKEVKSLLDGRKTEIREFPFVYDILSAKQLGTMMWEMGIGGLKVTDKSREKHEADPKKDLQIKTTKDEMDRLMNTMGDKFPFMNKIKRFRETQKALSTNLLPMYEDADENGDLRINFKQQGTDTGRFTTPGTKDRGEGLHGGTRFNLHSLPSTYDPSRPECMRRLRECIKAREGMFLAAIDFSGEELRIVTNLSGEPLWLEQFFRLALIDGSLYLW
jgi:DNA polymerase I-like protein with 3'-5' exonuclease and polymerase domains